MQQDEDIGNKAVSTKQYLINEDKFQQLKQFQQAVFKITEFSPSLRKIINELITEENLENMKNKFVSQWK
jgi:hypothetical protein